MSKLLPTNLPFATGDTVSADTFNRLIRILEINLGSVDPNAIQVFNSTELDELQFATGAIIFNTTTEVHQAFDGTEFRNLYEHQTYLTGLSVTMSIGSVTVSTP
tara:strand:- start:377 stop:688 length:312 start_codon:yes stop_codon:yes gene_type:complete